MSERKRRVGFPFGQIALILIAVLVLYLAFDFGRQVILSRQGQNELLQVEEKAKAAKLKNGELEKRLEYVRSHQAAEEWARQQGWVKANEVPVVLVQPTPQVPSGAASGAPPGSDATSNRNSWWDLFFGER